jgi:dTDP-4-dehydrorhamnose 3,5-epimerase-like enzyme
MKAETKAKQLFDKYCYAIRENEDDDGYFTNTIKAKRCALVAVEEVRFFHDSLFYATEGSMFDKYLNEVKQEIEKL